MSSIFDGGTAANPSAETEMAEMAKGAPELAADTPAETPAPEPADSAPETAPTGDPTTDTGQGPAPDADAHRAPKMVPIAALTEARQEARNLAQQLATMQGQMEAMQRMFSPQTPHPQAQQPEPPPDPEMDPIGALRYEREQRARLENHLRVQAVETRVKSDYIADAHRFASQTPDFPAAYNFLLTSRTAELRAQGYPEHVVRDQVAREEFQIAYGALSQQRSPAQVAYQLAEARGYKPVAASPAGKTPTDPALAEAKQRAAVSLSEGGKPEKGGDLSLEDIANLHGAAQDSALRKWEERHVKKRSIFDR